LIKTLFLTGARVSEFANIHVEDFFFDETMILLDKAKGGKSRYVPILPELESGENRLKVALGVVKMVGLQVNDIGPDDPEDIVINEARRRHGQMMQRLTLVSDDDWERAYQELIEKAGG